MSAADMSNRTQEQIDAAAAAMMFVNFWLMESFKLHYITQDTIRRLIFPFNSMISVTLVARAFHWRDNAYRSISKLLRGAVESINAALPSIVRVARDRPNYRLGVTSPGSMREIRKMLNWDLMLANLIVLAWSRIFVQSLLEVAPRVGEGLRPEEGILGEVHQAVEATAEGAMTVAVVEL
ncbi:MAG: hypothetical protein M1833_005299 [Piccolia ochrophora]|nr:MAG: hypothetical protein M1833_005299 [Piccolia ochrophora]